MKKIDCTIEELCNIFHKMEKEEFIFSIHGKLGISGLKQLAVVARKKYKNIDEITLLKRNVLINYLDLTGAYYSEYDRRELFKVLCVLPFKVINISEAMACLLCVPKDAFETLIPAEITDYYDPCEFSKNNFHDCGSYAYIQGLKQDGFWTWCAEPHLRYNGNLLNIKNKTEALLLNIEKRKKFSDLFDGMPELHFIYYLNHWQYGCLEDFFSDYPKLVDLPGQIASNSLKEKARFMSKIQHTKAWELECEKKELKYIVLDNKGKRDSVFHLKIIGRIGVGSLGCGEIYNWLYEQHFNGCFGVDLRKTFGLSAMVGDINQREVTNNQSFSVRFKYLYLPKETSYLAFHSFINQPFFTEISYSDDYFCFGDNALSNTSIETFKFPKEFCIKESSLPWGTLKEITLPDTFAVKRLFINDIVSESKYNQWDYIIKKCVNLKRINVPSGMDGFLLSSQKEFLMELKQAYPKIKIYKNDSEF